MKHKTNMLGCFFLITSDNNDPREMQNNIQIREIQSTGCAGEIVKEFNWKVSGWVE